tara:strand:+ start:49 stop:756 length:708 start_codon:yes stop_codon:yes gene_type:complete
MALSKITTESLLDGEVTDAKISALAASKLSGTIATARLGSGTASSSTFLRGDQTYAAAGGGLTLITSTTPSAAATVSFTAFDSSSYDSYFFTFENVAGADGQRFQWQTSTDGGSSYDGGASDYDHASTFTVTSSNGTGGDLADTHIDPLVGNADLGGLTTEGITGSMRMFSPDLALNTRMTWQFVMFETNGVMKTVYGGGQRAAASNVDAIRFSLSGGGNFVAQGRINFYGITNS